MEKLLHSKKAGEIHWQPRRKLHPHLYPTVYFEAHPNLKLKQAIRQKRMEDTIHDILHDSTPADLQRLEIKHITGEK